jgi:multisubunit Na+/H+ antiporter MnhE subunit
MIFASVAWVGLAATYLLFAGQISQTELIAGLGASLAAAAYALTARHVAEQPLNLRLPWHRVVARVAKSVVVDTIRVGLALIRATPGSLSRRASAPADAGHRAVAILALSLAPNGVVVDTQDGDVLLHQLVRAETREPTA